MIQERHPVIAGFSLPANAGLNRAAVRAGCKGQHPFPRAHWGGDDADALGVPHGAGRELQGEGVPGDRTSSGAGGKLRNFGSSLRHVRIEHAARGGTSPAL